MFIHWEGERKEEGGGEARGDLFNRNLFFPLFQFCA
jgi:hypothetical protein